MRGKLYTFSDKELDTKVQIYASDDRTKIPTKFYDHHTIGRKLKDLSWAALDTVNPTSLGALGLGSTAIAGEGNRLPGLAAGTAAKLGGVAGGALLGGGIGALTGGSTIGGNEGILGGAAVGAAGGALAGSTLGEYLAGRAVRKSRYRLDVPGRLEEMKKAHDRGDRYIRK